MIFIKKTFWEKHRTRIFLILLFFLGVSWSVNFADKTSFPYPLLEHISMAIAVSSLIAFIIELSLHREFAKNVFEAAIGYLLPEELRDELKWIYGFERVCENHTQTVHIEHIQESDLLKIKYNITRNVKNITDKTINLPLDLGTNEWMHEGHPSKIISYHYQKENGTPSSNLADKIEYGEADVHIKLKKIKKLYLKSGEMVTINIEFEETMNQSGWGFFWSLTPTLKSTVHLYAPDDIEARAEFDSRNNELLVKGGPHTWQLNSVLLPLQNIRIVWYPKKAQQKWATSIKRLA